MPYRVFHTDHRGERAAIAVALACLLASPARGMESEPEPSPFRLGLHAGLSVPIAQDDASAGFLYGLSARMLVSSRLAFSASVEVVRHRDGHLDLLGEEIDLTPPDLRGYAANADVFLLRSTALTLYGTVGLGAARLGHVRGDAETNFAGNVGGGVLLSLGSQPIWLEMSPRLHLVETEGATRKQLGFRLGVSYAIE